MRNRRTIYNDLRSGYLHWNDSMDHYSVSALFKGEIKRLNYVGEWDTQSLILCKFDLKGDRKYWNSVSDFMKWLGMSNIKGAQQWARDAYKSIRRARSSALTKSWEDVLPKEIRIWAWEELRKISKDDDFCDNWRVAKLGNTAQVRRYKSQRKHGCCGFSDVKRVGIDGNKYLLGYNYGH